MDKSLSHSAQYRLRRTAIGVLRSKLYALQEAAYLLRGLQEPLASELLESLDKLESVADRIVGDTRDV